MGEGASQSPLEDPSRYGSLFLALSFFFHLDLEALPPWPCWVHLFRGWGGTAGVRGARVRQGLALHTPTRSEVGGSPHRGLWASDLPVPGAGLLFLLPSCPTLDPQHGEVWRGGVPWPKPGVL